MTAADDWDDDWDDDSVETILGIHMHTFKLSVAAVVAVMLLLVASLVSTGFGLYSGVGSVTIAANYEGFEPLDEELKFKVYLTSPTLGRLSQDAGTYAVSYDGEVRAHGSFSYSNAGIGTVTIPLTNIFVANGEYIITASAGDASDSVSMDISRNADYAIGVINFHGSTYDDDAYADADAPPQVTPSFTDQAGPGGEIVFPVVSGYFDIYFFENQDYNGNDNCNDKNDPCDDNYEDNLWRACYWDSANPACSPTGGRPSSEWKDEEHHVQRVFFNISQDDSYSWNPKDESVQYGSGIGYTIPLDKEALRQGMQVDFTIVIHFTNSFAEANCGNIENTDCDREFDREEKVGRSSPEWFALEGK